MAYQTVFKRYELKFLLTKAQKEAVLAAMAPYMSLDKYGRTLICNLYFDTDDYRLIRRSIEKPVYKEKLRIRSYGVASGDSTVFVELKKKYDSVVYKRRLSMSERDALEWLLSNGERPRSQISDEIDYFLSYYKNLHPTVFLSYEREAYYSNDKSDFRVTFDENILGRTSDLSLSFRQFRELGLPGCLSNTRNLALVGKIAEANTADAVLTEHGVRTAAQAAAGVSTSRELRLLLLLVDHTGLSHVCSPPYFANGMPSAARSSLHSSSV